MSELDEELEDIRTRYYANLDASTAPPYSIEGRSLRDTDWLLYYVDVLRAQIYRLERGEQKHAI